MGAGAQQKIHVQVCMCAHRRLRSACASAQSDQFSIGALWVAANGLTILQGEN